jgi:alpha-N-arabinofuranosidase
MADAINAFNDFQRPDRVKVAAFEGARLNPDGLEVTLPARSVVMLELE